MYSQKEPWPKVKYILDSAGWFMGFCEFLTVSHSVDFSLVKVSAEL